MKNENNTVIGTVLGDITTVSYTHLKGNLMVYYYNMRPAAMEICRRNPGQRV